MNEKEAYAYLAERLGLKLELIPYFIDIYRENIIINPLKPESVQRLGRLLDLKPGQRLLDLACGKAGVSLPMVLAYKVNLTGVDITPDFIREAWARAEAAGLYHLCDFLNMDAKKFTDQAKGQWDAALMLGASFIWGGLSGTMEAISPLIRPGGRLAVGEPYYHPGSEKKEEYPFVSKEDTAGLVSKFGQVIDIIDDGPEGWRAYTEPARKVAEQLKADKSGQPGLIDFLNDSLERQNWEMKNFGWAVWVVQIG